eukprot:1813376-Pyramimonas_sp.AAC.1
MRKRKLLRVEGSTLTRVKARHGHAAPVKFQGRIELSRGIEWLNKGLTAAWSPTWPRSSWNSRFCSRTRLATAAPSDSSASFESLSMAGGGGPYVPGGIDDLDRSLVDPLRSLVDALRSLFDSLRSLWLSEASPYGSGDPGDPLSPRSRLLLPLVLAGVSLNLTLLTRCFRSSKLSFDLRRSARE